MEDKIDYNKISNAIRFYSSKGFNYIEVPWIVSHEANGITAPSGVRRFNCFFQDDFLGEHIASGEQGFLQMILEGNLKEGIYSCATPCHRDEKILDSIHKNYFFKVELINYLGRGSDFDFIYEESKILETANQFFSKYLETEIVKTESGRDIVSKLEGIELGSYGHREYKNFHWIYGTGVAEPRLSYVLNLRDRGYHQKDIPKSEFGSFDKIYEEVLELNDSLSQDNKLMALMELSDIIGSVEGYLEKNFPGVSFSDLVKMKDATKRAFRSGRRK